MTPVADNDERLARILKRVRKIELITRGLVKETLGGQYHSRFKGQGIEFDDFREYQPGDDVRFIDWNVTARMNAPFVRKYVEERELTVLLLVDVSGSGDYGSVDDSKRELAAELAAVFAFSAVSNQDKVGLVLFSDQGGGLCAATQRAATHAAHRARHPEHAAEEPQERAEACAGRCLAAHRASLADRAGVRLPAAQSRLGALTGVRSLRSMTWQR